MLTPVVELVFNELVTFMQLKDAAQLALKRMPSAEQEALSQVELFFKFVNMLFLQSWLLGSRGCVLSITCFFSLLGVKY